MNPATDNIDERFSHYEQLLLASLAYHDFDVFPTSIGAKMHNRPQWDNLEYSLDELTARKNGTMVTISNMSMILDDDLSATILTSRTGDTYDDYVDAYIDAVETELFLNDIHARQDELDDMETPQGLLQTASDIARYGDIRDTVGDLLMQEFYSSDPDYPAALQQFLDDREYTQVTITGGGKPDGMEKILEIAELPYEERKQLHDTYHVIETHARAFLHPD